MKNHQDPNNAYFDHRGNGADRLLPRSYGGSDRQRRVGRQSQLADFDYLRGEVAIEHLKQTGLYHSLSAAVAGARYQEVGDEGAIYPVTIDPTFTQQQNLKASDAVTNDLFGHSVAISGETVVIGAWLHDGAGGFQSGSAYVFVRSGGVWTEQQKLEASDGSAQDTFGFSVAISGETIVVGAHNNHGAAGSDQGSAYVFVRSGGVWSQQQKLEASDEGAR